MEIKLNEEQQLEMQENIYHLNTVKDVIESVYNENQETFVLNLIKQLQDDLYLLQLDLERYKDEI